MNDICPDTDPKKLELEKALYSLRGMFHRRLAKKRGLLVNDTDINALLFAEDNDIQKRLDRISRLRRTLHFFGIKKDV